MPWPTRQRDAFNLFPLAMILSMSLFYRNFIIFMYIHMCTPQCTYRSQKTICTSHFSPSTMWILGVEPRLSDLSASAFTHGAVSPAPNSIFNKAGCTRSVLGLTQFQEELFFLLLLAARSDTSNALPCRCVLQNYSEEFQVRPSCSSLRDP